MRPIDNEKPVVLTIAGIDPSGGAGIVADIKTIAAFECFPAAAITSITFQNAPRVFGAEHQSAATLRAQVEPIVQDATVAAAKTGMLPTAEIVAEVARLFREEDLPAPVVDPVMVSTSGHDLIGEEAFQILKVELLSVARLVTPNIPEAERLAGFSINTEADMKRAAEAIRSLGARAVLVKGGHRKSATDILLDEKGNFSEFHEEYIPVGEIHGSGCTLSAAIAASLGKEISLAAAIGAAKKYLTDQIRLIRSSPSPS
ncbi:MAG TPA: bifunctional hydroxymethylpyrimidine kinase/phosphomethylpyrimidine kinase [Pyrinomonadaceae bacterium]|nr:bifunctional hydroxymethylpyrimidine kinase/phosphomethylpyrimidine kinase [Pyrinomonadaceae bacterium]